MSVLVLFACPFVSGPPDLSQVDAVADSAVDILDTAPTTGPEGPEPHLDALTVTPEADRYDLSFTAVDGDLDIDGGTLRLSVGADVRTFAIPADLRAWSADGQGIASWTADVPCLGASVEWTAVLTDRAAHVSAPRVAAIDLTGLGTAAEGPTVDVGTPRLPATVCGAVDATGDEDRVRLTIEDDADLAVTLWWTGDADLDLWAWDADGVALAPSIGGENPHVLGLTARAGLAYEVGVVHVGGAASGEWQVLVAIVTP